MDWKTQHSLSGNTLQRDLQIYSNSSKNMAAFFLFVNIDKLIKKICTKRKRNLNGQYNSEKKNNIGGIPWSDFKTSYKHTVAKTV